MNSFKYIDPIQELRWDQAVAGHPDANFFHSSAWTRVLSETYGHRPTYLTAEYGGALCPLLPLVEVDSWLTGRRAVSLPFTDACNYLGADRADFVLALPHMVQEGVERGWKSIEFRGCLGITSSPQCLPSASYYEHLLDLRTGERQLLANLDGKTRNLVRKAEKLGVKAATHRDADAMHEYYRLHVITRRKHGLPPQSERFFLTLHEHAIAKGMGFVTLASLNSQVIAGAVYLTFGKTAVYKFSASDERFQEARPNNLVMWESILWLAKHGIEYLTFGRTEMGHEGLRHYKLGWGTSERQLDYFKYDIKARRYARERMRVAGWWNRVFRRLPDRMLRRFGTFLYRHLD